MLAIGNFAVIQTFISDPGLPIELFQPRDIEELKRDAELNQRFKFCRVCKIY